ncbi:MAG: hypothetical protein U0Q11_16685 [Vicinamibacterales bacterium]
MNKTLHFAVLTSLLLAGCGGSDRGAGEVAKDAAKPAETTPAAPAPTQRGCADSDKLPLTGLCPDRASTYVMRASASPAPADGCTWQILETQVVDDVLLYRGMKCQDRKTELEFAGGAHRAELQLVNSAFLGKITDPPALVYIYSIEGDTMQAVTDRAREEIGKKAAARCNARLANHQGWPSDAIVVDVPAADAGNAPKDKPRTACGPLGLNEDELSFWRAGQGFGWFFRLGEAPEFDPGSFMLLTKGPDGTWTPTEEPAR